MLVRDIDGRRESQHSWWLWLRFSGRRRGHMQWSFIGRHIKQPCKNFLVVTDASKWFGNHIWCPSTRAELSWLFMQCRCRRRLGGNARCTRGQNWNITCAEFMLPYLVYIICFSTMLSDEFICVNACCRRPCSCFAHFNHVELRIIKAYAFLCAACICWWKKNKFSIECSSLYFYLGFWKQHLFLYFQALNSFLKCLFERFNTSELNARYG